MKLRLAALLAIASIISSYGQAMLEQASSVDKAHLAYNLKTTVEAYNSVGSKSPVWNQAATNCLEIFAEIRAITNGSSAELINKLATGLAKLNASKCNDPLIDYLYTKAVYCQSHSPSENALAFEHAASALEKSGYPAIRKFYANYWAAYYYASLGTNQTKAESFLNEASFRLKSALEDNAMPSIEADQACDRIMTITFWPDPGRWNAYSIFEPALTNRWNGTSWELLAKGRAYLTYGWIARGRGYADSVADEGWTSMRHRLEIAADSLEAAWKLNPNDLRICLEMMRVELGQGKGPDRLELWFRRGMKLDPANYDVCYQKLEYLRPRWYGSIDEMIQFGRECTLNTNYAGSVRLLLADAHYEASRELQDESAREAYWKRTNVWPDIQLAFSQFFKLYPKEVGYRHNYARYAAWCGQWQEFEKQVKLFPSTNYSYFGGVERFNQMVKYAAQQTKKD